MTLRTLHLVEYRPREVRLHHDDLAALLPFQKQLEVELTPRRRVYRLTSLGYVGIVQTPRLRIAIRPKIPAANVYHLLGSTPSATDTSTPEVGFDAVDFLVQHLATQMSQRAANGLPRCYVEIADHQPFLQGRLDMAAQSRELPTARDRFHVQREEFTVDEPFHQMVKCTAETMLHSPFITTDTGQRLRAAFGGYVEVTSVPFTPRLLDTANRYTTPEDRPLADLCTLLLQALQAGTEHGTVSSAAFLVNMAKVFERYVARHLDRGLPGVVQYQREFCYHSAVPLEQPILVGRPDVVVNDLAQPRTVLDVKWKALDESPPARDLHQALAYAVGLACRDVRLVYPGRRNVVWEYVLPGEVRLTVQMLRVVGSTERCERAMRKLVRSLR